MDSPKDAGSPPVQPATDLPTAQSTPLTHAPLPTDSAYDTPPNVAAPPPSDYSQTLMWMHDIWFGMMHEKFRMEAEKLGKTRA